MINNVTIYGERCSGTNYLEQLIINNFNCSVTYNYGWKHFFGMHSLDDSDDTLFICITKNLCDWLNSLYDNPHHLSIKKIKKLSENERIDMFLNKEFYSIHDDINDPRYNTEIMEDRHIYTGERYKNVFELRHIKHKYLLEDLPNKVKNYIFIKYEDLINNFETTMNLIKNKGLSIKDNIEFPLNTNLYKNSDIQFIKKNRTLLNKYILNNENVIKEYEERLGYL